MNRNLPIIIINKKNMLSIISISPIALINRMKPKYISSKSPISPSSLSNTRRRLYTYSINSPFRSRKSSSKSAETTIKTNIHLWIFISNRTHLSARLNLIGYFRNISTCTGVYIFIGKYSIGIREIPWPFDPSISFCAVCDSLSVRPARHFAVSTINSTRREQTLNSNYSSSILSFHYNIALVVWSIFFLAGLTLPYCNLDALGPFIIRNNSRQWVVYCKAPTTCLTRYSCCWSGSRSRGWCEHRRCVTLHFIFGYFYLTFGEYRTLDT
nr:hypothetical protein [Cressdnaviricota sp.]